MSRIHALKFLILQTLNKNSEQIDKEKHNEIAKSLNVISRNDNLFISWQFRNKNYEIAIQDDQFIFYKRSEFDQPTDRNQIDSNEKNANEVVLKIINLSL